MNICEKFGLALRAVWFLPFCLSLIICAGVLSSCTQEIPAYDAASRFYQDFARVEREGKSFYVDTAGNYVFDEIIQGEDLLLNPAREKEIGRNVQGTYVVVRKQGKQGVLSASGEWLLPTEYAHVAPAHPGDLWRVTKNGKKSSFFKGEDLLVPFEYDDVRPLLDGIHFYVQLNGKWGIYHSGKKKLVVPAEYEAFDFKGSVTYVYARKNSKWGIINLRNEVLVPFLYEHESDDTRRGDWVHSFSRNGQKVTVHIPTGKETPWPQARDQAWDEIEPVNGRGYFSIARQGKYGLVDTSGSVLVEPRYDEIEPINDRSYFSISRQGKYGLVDTSGNVLVEPRYDEYLTVYDKGVFQTSTNGREVLLDTEGSAVIPGPYEKVYKMEIPEAEGEKTVLYRIRHNEQYGFYHPLTGRRVEPLYSMLAASRRFPGWIEVEQNEKVGLLNIRGEEILPPVYETIYPWKGGEHLVEVRRDEKLGLYDLRARRLVIPAEYSSLYLLDPLSGWVEAYSHGNRILSLFNSKNELVYSGQSGLKAVSKHHYLLQDQNDDSYSLVDTRTGNLEPLDYDSVLVADEDGLLILNRDGESRLWDVNKDTFLTKKYPVGGLFGTGIEPFESGKAVVHDKGKVGLINTKGEIIVPVVYDRIKNYRNNWAMLFKKQGSGDSIAYRYGFADRTGQMIVPVEYDYDESNGFYVYDGFTNDSLAYLKLTKMEDGNLLKGVATVRGRIIMPARYDDIRPFETGGSFFVTYDVKNERGYEMSTTQRITDGQFGIIDSTGKQLLELEADFERIDFEPGSGLMVRKNKELYEHYSPEGKLMWRAIEVISFRSGTAEY